MNATGSPRQYWASWPQRIGTAVATSIGGIVVAEPDGWASQVAVEGVTVFETDGIGIPSGGLAWSPDSRWLAILAMDGIHLIDTLGGRAPAHLNVPPRAFNGGYGLLAFA